MTRLLDEINKEQPKTGGRRSRIDEILADLSPEDAADLVVALDDHSVAQVSIMRVLAKRGYKVSQATLSQYRNRVI
jgi:hypothetical protein